MPMLNQPLGPAAPQNPFAAFYAITGVTFFGLFSGFSACMFDLTQISACVDYSEHALQVFKQFGDHVLNWFLQVLAEIMRRNPMPH